MRSIEPESGVVNPRPFKPVSPYHLRVAIMEALARRGANLGEITFILAVDSLMGTRREGFYASQKGLADACGCNVTTWRTKEKRGEELGAWTIRYETTKRGSKRFLVTHDEDGVSLLEWVAFNEGVHPSGLEDPPGVDTRRGGAYTPGGGGRTRPALTNDETEDGNRRNKQAALRADEPSALSIKGKPVDFHGYESETVQRNTELRLAGSKRPLTALHISQDFLEAKEKGWDQEKVERAADAARPGWTRFRDPDKDEAQSQNGTANTPIGSPTRRQSSYEGPHVHTPGTFKASPILTDEEEAAQFADCDLRMEAFLKEQKASGHSAESSHNGEGEF